MYLNVFGCNVVVHPRKKLYGESLISTHRCKLRWRLGIAKTRCCHVAPNCPQIPQEHCWLFYALLSFMFHHGNGNGMVSQLAVLGYLWPVFFWGCCGRPTACANWYFRMLFMHLNIYVNFYAMLLFDEVVCFWCDLCSLKQPLFHRRSSKWAYSLMWVAGVLVLHGCFIFFNLIQLISSHLLYSCIDAAWQSWWISFVPFPTSISRPGATKRPALSCFSSRSTVVLFVLLATQNHRSFEAVFLMFSPPILGPEYGMAPAIAAMFRRNATRFSALGTQARTEQARRILRWCETQNGSIGGGSQRWGKIHAQVLFDSILPWFPVLNLLSSPLMMHDVALPASAFASALVGQRLPSLVLLWCPFCWDRKSVV